MSNFLTKNWLERLLALIFALLLWVYVTGHEQSEMGFTVPLELTNIPAKMEIVNEPPAYVSLRVRGDSRVLNNIKPGKIKVTLDLSQLKEGKNTFTITREQVILPKGLTVTRISPSSLKIFAEEVVEKKVPVALNAKGIRASWKVKLEPPEVTVQGMRSRVEKIRKVKTQTFSLNKKDIMPGKSIKKTVELLPPGKGLFLFPDRVEVVIIVPPKGGKRP